MAVRDTAEKNCETTSGFNQSVLGSISNACHGHRKGGDGLRAMRVSQSSRPLIVVPPVNRLWNP